MKQVLIACLALNSTAFASSLKDFEGTYFCTLEEGGTAQVVVDAQKKTAVFTSDETITYSLIDLSPTLSPKKLGLGVSLFALLEDKKSPQFVEVLKTNGQVWFMNSRDTVKDKTETDNEFKFQIDVICSLI